jgi:hypothetical protein
MAANSHVTLIIIIALIPSIVSAKHLHPERWYQEKYCRGKMEVVMPDNTRCDCVTDYHAIEFDFAEKWAEGLGQALNYGFQANKRPAVYLIIEEPADLVYWIRLNSISKHYGLPVDTIKISPTQKYPPQPPP